MTETTRVSPPLASARIAFSALMTLSFLLRALMYRMEEMVAVRRLSRRVEVVSRSAICSLTFSTS